MKVLYYLNVIAVLILLCACSSAKPSEQEDVNKDPISFANQQLSLLLIDAEKENKIPRTLTAEGNMHWTKEGFDWTEGFFPGSCWYLYEVTNDEKLKLAVKPHSASSPLSGGDGLHRDCDVSGCEQSYR